MVRWSRALVEGPLVHSARHLGEFRADLRVGGSREFRPWHVPGFHRSAVGGVQRASHERPRDLFRDGCIFGTIFGIMDVEDEVSYQLGLALKREESYCYPIGGVLGFAGGVWNEYARARAEATLKTDWDEDI